MGVKDVLFVDTSKASFIPRALKLPYPKPMRKNEVLHNEVVPVSIGDKSVLRQLMELYKYDFSEFDKEDINEHGYLGYKYLDSYWTEKNRNAYFIKVDQKIAGFVLLNS